MKNETLTGIRHGDERTRIIRTGDTQHRRRERYCAVHGWFDTFLYDENQWKERHGNCGRYPAAGAAAAGK